MSYIRPLKRREQARRSRALPVKAVHHFELSSQLLLGQVVQHAGIHQGLHEVAAILWQAQAGQPVVAHPLMIHIAVSQYLEGDNHR